MIKLRLCFKGSRGYLHGSDIFNSLTSNLLEIFPDSFITNLLFRRFAKNQLCVFFDKIEDESKIIGHGNLKLKNKSIKKFWIKEIDDEVTSSYEFNEDLILSYTIINKNQISIINRDTFSLIENIIILTKKINYLICPLTNDKWIFSQIKLEKIFPNSWNKIDIILDKMKKKTYSESKIIIDNKNYGVIRFMTAKI